MESATGPDPGPDTLPDEAIVVRGGLMESGDLKLNAELHTLEHGEEWAISVSSAAGLSADEIARRSPFRHRRMRVSTVAAIRSLGHDVVPTGKPPHADLKLNDKPSEETWKELREVFEQAVPNPRYA